MLTQAKEHGTTLLIYRRLYSKDHTKRRRPTWKTTALTTQANMVV